METKSNSWQTYIENLRKDPGFRDEVNHRLEWRRNSTAPEYRELPERLTAGLMKLERRKKRRRTWGILYAIPTILRLWATKVLVRIAAWIGGRKLEEDFRVQWIRAHLSKY